MEQLGSDPNLLGLEQTSACGPGCVTAALGACCEAVIYPALKGEVSGVEADLQESILA